MRDCGCKSFLLRIPRIGYQLLAFASRPVPSFRSFSLPSPSASASHCLGLETSKWIRFFYESLMIFSVAFHSSGFVSSDPVSFPRSYPIVLTRVMERKYLSVALRFGTESAMMLLKLIVYHPIHTHTSVFVSSLTPPISQLFGILSRRFLFFASPQKEADC